MKAQEGKLQGGELLLNNFHASCSQQKASWLGAPSYRNDKSKTWLGVLFTHPRFHRAKNMFRADDVDDPRDEALAHGNAIKRTTENILLTIFDGE